MGTSYDEIDAATLMRAMMRPESLMAGVAGGLPAALGTAAAPALNRRVANPMLSKAASVMGFSPGQETLMRSAASGVGFGDMGSFEGQRAIDGVSELESHYGRGGTTAMLAGAQQAPAALGAPALARAAGPAISSAVGRFSPRAAKTLGTPVGKAMGFGPDATSEALDALVAARTPQERAAAIHRIDPSYPDPSYQVPEPKSTLNPRAQLFARQAELGTNEDAVLMQDPEFRRMWEQMYGPERAAGIRGGIESLQNAGPAPAPQAPMIDGFHMGEMPDGTRQMFTGSGPNEAAAREAAVRAWRGARAEATPTTELAEPNFKSIYSKQMGGEMPTPVNNSDPTPPKTRQQIIMDYLMDESGQPRQPQTRQRFRQAITPGFDEAIEVAVPASVLGPAGYMLYDGTKALGEFNMQRDRDAKARAATAAKVVP